MQWLLLSYKIPREPTTGRVAVWRKLRRLGAQPVQDAVWVLPLNARTREHLEWLSAEIVELGGEATVWQAQPLSDEQDQALASRFSAAVTRSYRAILGELRRKRADVPALARQYRDALARDYFRDDLGAQVRDALLAARKEAMK
jgi:hypothetical protein